jgi:hypothetical protein
LTTTILGSVLSFFEISNEDLFANYGIHHKDLHEFQNKLARIYSRHIFGKEFSIEVLRNMSEPIKNVVLIDLFETLINCESELINLNELKIIPNYEKIVELVNYLSELSDNLI